MKPGIYHDIEFDEYKSWNCMNCSTLKWASVSPRHLKASIDGELHSDSPARRFGRAVHCRLLEPEQYEWRIVIAQPCCVPLASGARKGEPCGKASTYRLGNEWFCGQHKQPGSEEPDDYVSRSEAESIERIAESVQRHEVVRMLRAHGGAEVSVVWEQSGVLMKGRLDKWIPSGSCPATIVDLKKCQRGKITGDECEKAIANYSYHVAAAAYVSAIEALENVRPVFIWVFVEDAYPHDVNVIHCDDETLDIGRQELIRDLSAYKACSDSGDWPGVATEITTGGLPGWYRKRFTGGT